MADPRRTAVWSPEALADLSDIWRYLYSAAGIQTADKITLTIHQASMILHGHPHAGRPRDEIRKGLRSISVGPHVIFYRVTSERAEIIRVLDGRRDLDEIFRE